jgi:DNA-directed RNA polymerase subunit RPC12/RpoP
MSITKQAFINKQKSMIRSSNRWAVIFLVVFFGVLLANLSLAKSIDRAAIWTQVFYAIVFFSVLIGTIPLVMWFQKRQQKRFSVQCSSCGRPLVDISAQIVIATGNCGHCGERVLHEARDA